MDYTTLRLAEVRSALKDVARDTQETFGPLDARQLNWQPEAARWSVAQCLDHLIATNRLMLEKAEEAMRSDHPRSIWQRLPGLPRMMGRMMVSSQSPTAERKFKAFASAIPAPSDIGSDVIQRFVDQHLALAARVDQLDEHEAQRAIMVSPFVSLIPYSVLDGFRLMVAHDRRHFEQARRVTAAPGFPRG
jgi:hypothetical protein